MSRKLILFYILLLLCVQTGLSQTTDERKKSEELKKEAVLFLRETAVDAGTLRTLENRISFASEIANLMWYHDEKEARAMFQAVIVDFRQLLIQADSEFTLLDARASDNDDVEFDLFGGSSNSRDKLLRKFRKAVSVRQQITLSIMEHDPQMAYDFFTGTAQAVANPKLREQFESNDVYFEIKLANAIADTNVDKALEAGRKRLAKGASFELIGLMKKIYEKDADKGATFGEEIFSKIKSDSKTVNLNLLSSLLSIGADNLDKLKEKPGKKPIFSESALREIADVLAQEILKLDTGGLYQYAGYVKQIERFSPSRAAQIRQKLKQANSNNKDVVIEEGGIGYTEGIVDSEDFSAAVPINAEKNEQQNLAEKVQSLNGKQLSKEEKEKIVGEARQSIAKIKNREMRIVALSMLASQFFKMGDKELAGEIMNEARALVNLQPKNYKDFIGVWMLASGYAQADPERAFPLLEDAILRLNETISAMIKLGEFMDVNEEIIEGDEVQVGAFGGSMTRDLLGALGASNSTLQSLAAADFARTKDLTNKFNRLEVRILAKMLVLRAVLSVKEKEKENDVEIPIPVPKKP